MSLYKVGQKVKVREWDDMERQYGIDEWGTIQCKARFTEEMRCYCGKMLTISFVRGDSTYGCGNNYNWSDDMLLPYIPNRKE